MQGWGNVGAAAGYYLSQAGALLTGIVDRSGGVLNENGFTHDEVISLFHSRTKNMFEGFTKVDDIQESFWKQKADVFIPAAASRLVTLDQLSDLHDSGLKVIACGANVPFADPEIFFGPIGRFADHHMSVVPDFISNCGMARVFAYLMSNDLGVLEYEAIFKDASETIKNALKASHHKNNSKYNIAKTAFENKVIQIYSEYLGKLTSTLIHR